MKLRVELDREADGRWIAEVVNMPRVSGVVAWFVRRSYYLLQMPGWTRRLRIMIDWTFALFFRPDVVKLNLDTEAASLLRDLEGEALAREPSMRE